MTRRTRDSDEPRDAHNIVFKAATPVCVVCGVYSVGESERILGGKKKSDATKKEVNLWVNLFCFKRPRTKAPYQIVIGRDSPLLHGAGWPPLSDGLLPLIRRLLGKGCPGVVRLAERALRPARGPAGRLAADGIVSKCCL